MVGLLAARALLAEVAADAADAADLRDLGSAHGVVAEDVDGGGRGDELDELARAHAHALATADAEALVHDREAVGDRDRVFRAHVRARAVAEAAEAAALVAARRGGGGRTVADAVVVAHADRLRARAAALDERDALFGGGCRDAEDLGEFRVHGVAAGRARAGSGGSLDEGARVVGAAGEAAAAAVRAGKGGRGEADAGIFLHGEVFVRNRQRERREGADAGDYQDGC